MVLRRHTATFWCVLFLFLLPVTLFVSVTLGNATLLPADNLFAWSPFHALATTYGVALPQNHLLSDLILENYQWKTFILESIQKGELPLWNPYLFAGAPFLAGGQSSALYPLSILYYILPLDKAYGWFTVANLGLAGIFMFLFVRVLGLRRRSALVAGVSYEFSAFLIVSVVFPMFLAAAAWLPLILAMCECIIQKAPGMRGRQSYVPWMIIGALAIAVHILAGHIEITLYTALITGFYCIWRLVTVYRETLRIQHPGITPGNAPDKLGPIRTVLYPSIWLVLMATIGAGIGAIQLVPLLEVVQTSFRAARTSFQEVLGYGFPLRHILLWLMPNFYGNPATHTYFDLFTWSIQPVATASGNTDWGIKNYVEGGVYVGVLTLGLALLAVAVYLRHKLTNIRILRAAAGSPPSTILPDISRVPVGFFIILSIFSIAFIFGTPLYAILYYGFPGINQLHSPFRWVYALTICLTVLASVGMDWLIGIAEKHKTSTNSSLAFRVLNRLAQGGTVLGLLLIAALIVIRIAWPVFNPLLSRILNGLAKANEGFNSAQSFYSYEARNLALFAAFLIAGCILVLLARHHATRYWWSVLIIGVIVLDLHIAWLGFNPSVDPALLQVTPSAIQFLQHDQSQWRFTTYDPTGQKPLNANAGWAYHLQDIRGYDSIIPKQYVDYMQLIEPQNELPYNRIAPLSQARSLDSPLLDELNVKYVMTEISVTIPNPGYHQVYEGEGVRIYQNENVMPRAFTLPANSALLSTNFAVSVQDHDPRRYAIIDASCGITDTGCVIPGAGTYTPASITVYKNNEVWVDAQVTETSWLILADSYYPGWHAFIRPLGGTDKDEHEVPIGLVNGNFRAVRLDMPGTQPITQTQSTELNSSIRIPSNPGQTQAAPSAAYTIRFKYSPDSFRTGAFITFLAVSVLILIAGMYLWRTYYHEGFTSTPVKRIAKNSLVLTSFNLVSRLIDFAFAILMLRVLGPEGVGKFTFAVVIIGWFDILMNFGLNTFLTREVARDKANANKYLYNTSILRLLLGLGSGPLVILVIVAWQAVFHLANDTALVIVLLAVSQVISSMATGFSALFFAFEKAEFPATLTIVSALISITLRAIALLAGFGIVGLAVASIATNLITLVILFATTIRTFFVPHRESDTVLRRAMLRESLPLMVNHLLATLFFKIDVPLLEAIKSSTVVGWYSAAYKYVDAFNIIPAYFTQSIFPVMSRMAIQADDAMARSYTLALKLLVMTALPIAVLSTFLATFMIGLLGGSEFLPHGAIALTIMVWSIPFGWINSITNYALIAVNQQRALTRAFIIGLVFNVVANLVLIPTYSYQAAAAVTILSEIVEGAAFYVYVRRHIVAVNWYQVLGRPAIAAALMAGVIYISSLWSLLAPGLFIGTVAYLLALLATKALSPVDLAMLSPLIPARIRARLIPVSLSGPVT